MDPSHYYGLHNDIIMTYIDYDLKVTSYTVCMLTTSMVMMGSGKFGFLEASFMYLDRRTVPPHSSSTSGEVTFSSW